MNRILLIVAAVVVATSWTTTANAKSHSGEWGPGLTTGYGDGNYLLLASDRRVDGVMLDALIQDQKDSDLIPKLVTGLLAHAFHARRCARAGTTA